MLESLGWRVVRVRGSHARLVLEDGTRPISVPLSQRELKRGTFQSILQQAVLTRRAFDSAAQEIL